MVNSAKKFSDVTSSTWCYKYVAELADSKVIDGYADGSFKPDNTITYGAALKLIMLAAGYPEQKPVNSNVFSGYLAKARAEGISVICVFTGVDEDIPSAKLVYGRDFARIQSVDLLADTVGTLLQNQIRSI